MISFQSTLLRREQGCPPAFSPALLFSHHLSRTGKAEAARTKVSVQLKHKLSNQQKIAQNQSEDRRGLPSQGPLWGGERTLHFFLGSQEAPGTWLVYTLGARWPQPWCPDRGDV